MEMFSKLFDLFKKKNKLSRHIKVTVDDITKGSCDSWKYCGLVLNNDIKVLLISDPNTDKAAASLDVNAGSMMDPTSTPGLAHLCEHMLFMGAFKYNKYLCEHGGSSNGYTTLDHTNFYFDVAAQYFKEALCMFSEVLKHPSYTQDHLSSEMNAIDQEFRKNKDKDEWRISEIEKLLALSQSDYVKFSSGNKHSLLQHNDTSSLFNAINLFYHTWYSSSLMAITIFGRESIEELQEMAVIYFSGVKNNEISPVKWEKHPLCLNKHQIIRITPLRDVHWLRLTFPIPDLNKHYKSGPCFYIGYFLNAKCQGSLSAVLQDYGWIQDLIAVKRGGAAGFAFYDINIDLTLNGLDHIDDIIHKVFQYFRLVRIEALKGYLFEECQQIARLKFNIKDIEHAHHCVSNLSQCLHTYPLEDVLSAGYILTDFKHHVINMFLMHITPDNLIPYLITKTLHHMNHCTEKWYSTSYSSDELHHNIINYWKSNNYDEEFKLPSHNIFIPQDFNLKNKDSHNIQEYPSLLVDDEYIKVWYKPDNYYNLPKAVIFIHFISPYAQSNVTDSTLINLYVWIVRHKLKQYLSSAELLDYYYCISATKAGITVSVKGFNDKLNLVLKEAMKHVADLQIDVTLFNNLKDSYIRYLENFKLEEPYKQAIFYTSYVLSHKAWTKDELCDAVQDIQKNDIDLFRSKFLSRLKLEMLLHGNLSEHDAYIIYKDINSMFEQSSSYEMEYQQELLLTPGVEWIYLVPSESESSCVQLYHQTGVMTSQDNLLLQLICQIINGPAVHHLRTKQQLGYIVQCELRRNNSVQGLKIVVQGSKEPHVLLKNISIFIKNMEVYLEELSQHEFQLHVAALHGRRLEKPKKMSSLTSKWWFEITTRQCQFNRDHQEINVLQRITKNHLIEFYKNNFIKEENCRKLCVCVYSKTAPSIENMKSHFKEYHHKVQFIDDTDQFKMMHTNTSCS